LCASKELEYINKIKKVVLKISFQGIKKQVLVLNCVGDKKKSESQKHEYFFQKRRRSRIRTYLPKLPENLCLMEKGEWLTFPGFPRIISVTISAVPSA
jgi:hypothetical protein